MIRPALLLAFTSIVYISDAKPIQESHRLRDQGQPREFVIVRDEVHSGRRAKRIPARASIEETSAAAREIAGDFVLYEKGIPRTELSRRILTKRISVHLAENVIPVTIANAANVRLAGPAPGGASGWWIMESAPEPGSALEAAETLRRLPGVLSADPLLARQQNKRFVPNDPLFGQQWHLNAKPGNTGLNLRVDVNVQSVWDQYRGTGVVIGIVDDGIERTHPDLISNYNGTLSYDFNGGDADPLPPPYDGDDHGTSCAGVAAARGNNVLGVCGAAFESQLAGLRLIAQPTTDAEEADALTFRNDAIHIKSNSWGPSDDGRRLEGPGPLTSAAFVQGVREGRDGLGTIYVWAGGNGGAWGDSSSFDGYASRREVIAVGALSSEGEQSYYSEPGTNLLVTAPSDGGRLGIVTADRQGEDGYNMGYFGELDDLDYTNTFGGTSSACPLVSGCIALILQANPRLGWRDVQEILIRTARQVQPEKSGWNINTAGFHFHEKFGAGLIDTQAAVNLAKTWTNLSPEISISREQSNIAQPIPDNRATGIEKTFVFNDDGFRVEHVCLTVDILHAARGQVEVSVESPAGTISRLIPARLKDKGDHYLGWTFMSTHFWGENAAGTWKVRVIDRSKGTVGTLRSLKMELFGSSLEGHVAPEGFTTISGPDGFISPGETVTVNFAIRNAGQTATTNLTGTLLETGGVSAPSSSQEYGAIPAGQASARPFTFTAIGKLGETIHATIELNNGTTSLGTVTFPITLGRLGPTIAGSQPGTLTFSSKASVQIPAVLGQRPGNARPYFSTVEISGLPENAVITKVKLHLHHLAHARSADIDMLLVSPGGKKIIPLSDIGADAANDIDLVLDDAATNSMPETSEIFSGTYRPTNRDASVDPFPAPAPPKPYDANFAAFHGTPAAGTWKLFIRDDKTRAAGGLGQWSLEISYAY